MAFLQINGVDYQLPDHFDEDTGEQLQVLRTKVTTIVNSDVDVPAISQFEVVVPGSKDSATLHVRNAAVWSALVSGPKGMSSGEAFLAYMKHRAEALTPKIARAGRDPLGPPETRPPRDAG
jgi:hypothetical protein